MKNKISKINKLTKRSKILIGATTTIAIGSAVVLPVVISSNKETKSKKTKISEALKNLTEEELEKNDKTHLKNQNRKKWYPGDPKMNKWIKDAIHKIKGLESLPNNDIVINHDNKNGKIDIKIENHGTSTPLVLENFLSINTLKDAVNTEYAKAPKTKDTDGYQDLFDDIKEAKDKALADIQNAKTSEEINQAKTKGVNEIQDAITAYNQDLAKNQSNNLINNEYDNAPKTKDTDGDQDLFDAIQEAKAKALANIKNANNHQEINQAQTKGVTAIKKAITAYNQDLAATKFANDKNAKKIEINKINPQSTLTDGATNPTEYVNALAQAKKDAKNAIQNASSADLSSIFNTQKGKVEIARDAYDTAIQAANLAFTKNQAKDAVNTEYAKAPEIKDTDGYQTLFDDIKEAHTQALADIQDANTSEKIDQAKEDGLWAIKEAINIYNKYLEFKNQSDITQAKKIANGIIDSINPGIDLIHGLEFTSAMQSALNQSKADAKTEINGKSDQAAITDSLNKNLPLVKEARDTLKQNIRKAIVVKNVVKKLPTKLIGVSVKREDFSNRSINREKLLQEIIKSAVIVYIQESAKYKGLKQNEKNIIDTWLLDQKIDYQKNKIVKSELYLQFSDRKDSTYQFEVKYEFI